MDVYRGLDRGRIFDSDYPTRFFHQHLKQKFRSCSHRRTSSWIRNSHGKWMHQRSRGLRNEPTFSEISHRHFNIYAFWILDRTGCALLRGRFDMSPRLGQQNAVSFAVGFIFLAAKQFFHEGSIQLIFD